VTTCIGLVAHPSRAIDRPLEAIREWAGEEAVELAQVAAPCRQQRVAEPGDPCSCDLIVSIGGDGTTLAAIRTGAEAGRPVLGVACGSLGALATVGPDDVYMALGRFSRDDWVPFSLPALDIASENEDGLFAMNDVVVVRDGQGQVQVRAQVDGVVFARLAGDGCIISTPIGSSAYALAAQGPLLSPDTATFLLTPLAAHGGSCPPLVLSATSELRLEVAGRLAGARLEIDGQRIDREVSDLRIGFRSDAATVVRFADQEPYLARLRRRRIIIDSPRILAEEIDQLGGYASGRDRSAARGRADLELAAGALESHPVRLEPDVAVGEPL
jgi:NAD+ kinase